MIHASYTLLWLASALLANADVPACFYPNGIRATGDYACDLTAENSFCCAIGYVCLENKICSGNDYVNNTAIPWNRGSCTDPTWQSDDCPKFCETNSAGRASGTGSWVVQCDDATNDVCCFDSTADAPLECCSNATETTFTLQGAARAERVISSNAATLTRSLVSSTATATTTPTSSSSPTRRPARKYSKGLSAGAYAGVAIGAVAGVALLCALVWFLYSRRLRNKQTSPVPEQPYYPVQDKDTDVYESDQAMYRDKSPAVHEHDNVNGRERAVPAELETRRQMAELSTE